MTELEQLINKAFQEYPDRFFQRKIKDFISSLFPEINQCLSDKIDKQSNFNPENFRFLPCSENNTSKIYRWKSNNIEIFNIDYSVYRIIAKSDLFRGINDSAYSSGLTKDEVIFFGVISNHFEAKILFKNLGLI